MDGPVDPSFWADIWELAKAAGPFGTLLMLVMYWLERQDRLKVRGQLDDLTERVVVAMTNSTNTLSELLKILTTVRKR